MGLTYGCTRSRALLYATTTTFPAPSPYTYIVLHRSDLHAAAYYLYVSLPYRRYRIHVYSTSHLLTPPNRTLQNTCEPCLPGMFWRLCSQGEAGEVHLNVGLAGLVPVTSLVIRL